MAGLRSWQEPLVEEHAKLLGAECMTSSVPDYSVELTWLVQMCGR
jgi:hypothetical protein